MLFSATMKFYKRSISTGLPLGVGPTSYISLDALLQPEKARAHFLKA
jgi:hypothetical protein